MFPHKRRAVWLGALLTIVMVAAGHPASADLPHWIRITGATQGVFPGGSDIEPFVGWTQAFEYHHLIERPSAGASTVHETVISTFSMDEPLVPHLLRALDADEALTVQFDFVRPTSSGAEEIYAIITLNGARIVSIEPLSPTDQDPALSSYQATVRVRFSYASLSFEYEPNSDTATLVNGGS